MLGTEAKATQLMSSGVYAGQDGLLVSSTTFENRRDVVSSGSALSVARPEGRGPAACVPVRAGSGELTTIPFSCRTRRLESGKFRLEVMVSLRQLEFHSLSVCWFILDAEPAAELLLAAAGALAHPRAALWLRLAPGPTPSASESQGHTGIPSSPGCPPKEILRNMGSALCTEVSIMILLMTLNNGRNETLCIFKLTHFSIYQT